MRELDSNSSHNDIIEKINELIVLNNAVCNTLMNLSKSDQSAYLKQQINNLEKKFIIQGDMVVSLTARLQSVEKAYSDTFDNLR